MSDPEQEEALFLGLTGLKLDFDQLEFGKGIVLRRTYAHLMAPYLMAFAPAPLGKHHPGPLKPAGGGGGFDIVAELALPVMSEHTPVSNLSIGKVFVALMRLWASPSISAPVVSSGSFSDGATDSRANFTPLEVGDRYFRLQATGLEVITRDHLEWVRVNWEKALALLAKHAEVRLALEAIDRGQFIQNQALILVSLWGALEALFSPAKNELRFRVSANIASFLEPPGEARLALHKRTLSLYDARSSAAHGAHKSDTAAILGSFELLRRVLIKMLSEQHVPTKEELERRLFGAHLE